jgi:hypothetical protein
LSLPRSTYDLDMESGSRRDRQRFAKSEWQAFVGVPRCCRSTRLYAPPSLPQNAGMGYFLQLGRLMDDVQTLFESMVSTDKQTTFSRAAILHDRLLQFRSTLDDDYDVFEQMDTKFANHLRERTPETVFVRITVYGLYLQLRMLVSLPMLEQATWEAIQRQTSSPTCDPDSPESGDPATECERVAALTVSMDGVYDSSGRAYRGLRLTDSNVRTTHCNLLGNSRGEPSISLQPEMTCSFLHTPRFSVALSLLHLSSLCRVCHLHGCPPTSRPHIASKTHLSDSLGCQDSRTISPSSRHARRGHVPGPLDQFFARPDGGRYERVRRFDVA